MFNKNGHKYFLITFYVFKKNLKKFQFYYFFATTVYFSALKFLPLITQVFIALKKFNELFYSCN